MENQFGCAPYRVSRFLQRGKVVPAVFAGSFFGPGHCCLAFARGASVFPVAEGPKNKRLPLKRIKALFGAQAVFTRLFLFPDEEPPQIQ